MRRIVAVPITLPKALLRDLDRMCREEELNRSAVIGRMVRAYLAKNEKQAIDHNRLS
jgi:metal-responsive CopG/Arc/MetJ family transcriptional regulator